MTLPDRLPLPVPVLVGERVLLRALCPGDAPALQRHADDAQVARYLNARFPHPYTAAHAQAWCGHEANSGAFGYVWGLVANEAPAEVLGCIGLIPQADWLRCNAEVGYWVGREHWRRGLASDALCQVTDWAFAALPHLTRIFAPILAGNTGSQAVARKCGFVLEGVMRRSAMKLEKAVDRELWATYRGDEPVPSSP